MKKTIIAWLLFFIGITIEMIFSKALSSQDSNLTNIGIPENLGTYLLIIFSYLSVWLAYKATQPLKNTWKQLLVTGLEIGAGFVIYKYLIYTFIGIYYLSGAAIDNI